VRAVFRHSAGCVDRLLVTSIDPDHALLLTLIAVNQSAYRDQFDRSNVFSRASSP
jgi:hypothetical protein